MMTRVEPAKRGHHADNSRAGTHRKRGLRQADLPANAPRLFRDEARTETANARLFVEHHGEDVRWCEPWGKWLVWDDRRWRIDDCCLVPGLAKQTAEFLWREADPVLLLSDHAMEKAITAFLRSSNSARGVADFLTLARSEPQIPISPQSLDNHAWLFNAANGTLDLRTGALAPHDRGDYLTKLSPVVYDESATCPTWERFLKDVFAEDEEMVRFVQRAAGYSLTGVTHERCLFFLHGRGRNGKTTLVSTLQKVWGDYATQITTDMLMTSQGERHPTEICDLAGRRLAVASETEDGRRLAESFVKQITGGEDVLKARRMREDFWEFRATHKLWLSGNHKPSIRGTDDAIWDRLRLIPFGVRFDDPDTAMPDKLAAELPGILSWCVRGCLDWQEHGLCEPAEVTDATSAYRGESDVLGQFIADCCVVSDGCRAGATDLHKAYMDWGGKIDQQRFGSLLRDRGFRHDRFTAGPQKGRKCWHGIGLLSGDRE